VPGVDQIAHRLPDQMAGKGVTGETMGAKQLPFFVDIFLAGQRRLHIEVVAPTGELDTIVAHGPDHRGKFLQGQIGPLAGEQRDRTWHGVKASRMSKKG